MPELPAGGVFCVVVVFEAAAFAGDAVEALGVVDVAVELSEVAAFSAASVFLSFLSFLVALELVWL